MMMRLLVAVSLVIATLALPRGYQRCEAEDHQPASAHIQESRIPASVVSPTPSLPSASAQADQGHDESWNRWDAIAPSTWNGWALTIMAGFAAWIAIRTLSQIKEQVKAEQKSVDLMRTEYAASHRPRIRVRNVVIDLNEIDVSNESKLCQTRITFYVVNYGESDAILANAQYSIIVGESLPMQPYYRSEFISKINRVKLSSGEGANVAVTGEQYPLLPVLQKNHPLFVIGYIDYRGTTGVTYRTAFARAFEMPAKRFTKIQNPDYEYEE